MFICRVTFIRGGRCIFLCSCGRRHTRWPRDWSSDVCSSALKFRPPSHRLFPVQERLLYPASTDGKTHELPFVLRSEERRVGKEWRSQFTRVRSEEYREGRPSSQRQ